MVLLIGEIKLLPLTVKLTVTPVDEVPGVMTTDDAVDVVGVAPVITQLYVGDVMF